MTSGYHYHEQALLSVGQSKESSSSTPASPRSKAKPTLTVISGGKSSQSKSSKDSRNEVIAASFFGDGPPLSTED